MLSPQAHHGGDRRPPSIDPNNILSRSARRASRIVPDLADFDRAHGTPNPKAEYAAWVCELAQHLPPSERELVYSVFQHGRPLRELAKLLRLSDESLRRRLRRLIARISTPEFAFVALRRGEWPASLRDVATAIVIEGKSLRATQRDLRISMHAVRTLRQRALAMARGAQETTALLAREAPGVDRQWRSMNARERR